MKKCDEKRRGLSSNALKIIAAVSMLLDHIGVILLPHATILRILGRIAFPIFAFMIAEGCAKTKNKRRYFLSVFLLGAACQVVYCLYDDQLYLGILITFSISILLIYALQALKKVLFGDAKSPGRKIAAVLAFLLLLAGVYVLNLYLTIDYGFWGCLLPVFASVFRTPSVNAPAFFKKLDRLSVHVISFWIGLAILACARRCAAVFPLRRAAFAALFRRKRCAEHEMVFLYLLSGAPCRIRAAGHDLGMRDEWGAALMRMIKRALTDVCKRPFL